VRAAVELAGLSAKDVRVEAVVGRVGSSGTLEDTEVIVLAPTEESESVAVFAKEITPRQTGRLGYALRVSPNHYDDPLTRPCPDLLRWG
jgi:starch phosphorylase